MVRNSPALLAGAQRSVPPHATLYEGRHVSDFVLDLVYQLQNGGGMTSRIAAQGVRSTDPAPIKYKTPTIDEGGGGILDIHSWP